MDLDIEKIVRQQVVAEIHEMDLRHMVKTELIKLIRDGVGDDVVSEVREEAKAIIVQEIAVFLDGPVEISDGYVKKTTHDTFEDFFRSQFKDQLDKKFEVRRAIKEQVTSRINQLIKQDYDRVAEKIVDEITQSRLVKQPAA